MDHELPLPPVPLAARAADRNDMIARQIELRGVHYRRLSPMWRGGVWPSSATRRLKCAAATAHSAGGLVIPVGAAGGMQRLIRLRRSNHKERVEEMLAAVSFVPLIGEEA